MDDKSSPRLKTKVCNSYLVLISVVLCGVRPIRTKPMRSSIGYFKNCHKANMALVMVMHELHSFAVFVIFASYKKSGTRNTIVTSDLRAEMEIWPFRACVMHPAIII